MVLAETPTFFTPTVFSETPYADDSERIETYEATDVSPVITIPLGNTLLDTVKGPIAILSASNHVLGTIPGFEKNARLIENGIRKMEEIPHALQEDQTIVLNRGEFRFQPSAKTPTLPEEDTIVIEGKPAIALRSSIIDFANNGMTRVSGYAQLAIRTGSASPEATDSAEHIIDETRHLEEALRPFTTADVYVVVYEPGKSSAVIPHTYGNHVKP